MTMSYDPSRTSLLFRSRGVFLVLRLALVTPLLLLALAACGGGGGGGDASDPSRPPADNETFSASIRLSLADPAGVAVHELEQGGEAFIKARVTRIRTVTNPGWPDRESREPAVGIPVKFTASGGEITPASGTALTNADGEAQVRLVAGSEAGAYAVEASVTEWGGASAQLHYAIGRTFKPAIQLSLMDSEGRETTDFEPGERGQIGVRVMTMQTEADGTPTGLMVPAVDTVVLLGTDGGAFDPSSGELLTNEDGMAYARFEAALSEGAFVLTAAVEDTSVSFPFRVQMPRVSMNLVLDNGRISAGGQTAVTAFLNLEDGEAYGTAVPVDFTSNCMDAGHAAITTPAISSGGRAIATYRPGPYCVGDDRITASLSLPGQVLPIVAVTTVRVAAPDAGRIAFVELDHPAIAVQGSGVATLPGTATASFRVTSNAGAPIPGATVVFSLNSSVGGARVTPEAVSDADGVVRAQVTAGDRPAVVRVNATEASTRYTTQSSQLSITTGRALQGGFVIHTPELNPDYSTREAEIPVHVYASEMFFNPVPDGTLIHLMASKGSIDQTCVTVDGSCVAMWRSMGIQPGRVVILATTGGDESFVDRDGDGVFSAGDTFTDMPEAWLDLNENGRWDAGEPFLDRNGNGKWDAGNALYDGLLCDPASGRCGDPKGIDVRDSLVLSLATTQLQITLTPNPINISPDGARMVTVQVRDSNGNLPPAGTRVALATTVGTLDGQTEFIVGSSSAPGPFVAQSLLRAGPDVEEGVLTVTVSAPGGASITAQATVDIGAGNGGCGFSPCPGLMTASVASVDVQPSTIPLRPGETRSVPLTIRALDAGRHNVGGVNMVVRCHGRDGGSAQVHHEEVVTSHSADRPSTAQVEFWPGAAGTVDCTVTAGDAQGRVRASVGGP